ncbi:TPA: SDR family NAD(P)-dependent oxidoreductase [Klebsiella oxytoca]|uniref:Sulfoacetaldehyde reductase n=1 Tax=Klebsiella oxytoca TaxID=571 RepID=A0A6N3BEA7_KLEOX|nr:SDR family oxidoreductase [Klebsiella oxytoca]MBG2650701.1 SDR family oxidoreductase [Klebsiella oxytoca]MBL0805336.1 SDR family oxidoreductase [Klebsiella oxytoca]MBZ6766106.1 SDR family oxidoreductase [Klebsiella oxytoca]CAG0329218.1 Sulfoacetaldehyde reductase [Klebsiella oxytoca]CAH6087339.1 Sulfoacetaldehyde reductase [Klebsiella oxytoca]
MSSQSAVLVTGASTGIGAVYAERFARRGHDLVLVARHLERLTALAERLRGETGVQVDILQADLTQDSDITALEQRLREDAQIGILINNAGTSIPGDFLNQSSADITRLITLNVAAVTRLANAIAPRLTRAGAGAIVNIASVVGLGPEMGLTVYGATKAFVLFLSQGLDVELSAKGVYVQAVLPAATRTEIWQHSGKDVNAIPGVMEVEKLVDAALVGFDRRELVTIPPLQDETKWQMLNAMRQAMLPAFVQSEPAARYLA